MDDATDLLFDWRLNLERLEQDARRAITLAEPTRGLMAEAQCSLELLDAELLAAQAKRQDPRATVSIAHLSALRGRVHYVLKGLSAAPSA